MKFIFLYFIILIHYNILYFADCLTYFVSTYGAYPNDNIDDTVATQAAVNSAISIGGGNVVVFGMGIYNFRSAISIVNAANLTIMGQGIGQTILIGNSPAAMFQPYQCRGLTITSLSIDFDPLPFTAGYVVNVNTNYLDVQIVPPHRADIGRKVEAILRYDPLLMRPAIGRSAYEIYQTPPINLNTSLVSAGVLRIPLSSPSKFTVGNAIVARFSAARHAIDAQDVTDFTIHSLAVYAAWSMGSVTLRAKRLNINDYHVARRDGRWMSASADCMHFADSREYINIIDSSCEAQGDDGLNVHAFYFSVSHIVNSTALIIEEYNWLDVLNVGVGTRLEFSRSQQQFTVYATAILASSLISGPTSRIFILTTPVNVSIGDWVSVADTPTLTIRNLTVSNNRARGVLLKTRNVHMTHSLFNGTSGPAVLFEPSMYWHESVAAQNVTLSHNVYINCNEGIAREKGIISFAPNPRQLIPIFLNIVIEKSTFLFGLYTESLIQGNNGGNVFIQQNYISTNTSISLISICNSQNFSSFNNTVVNFLSTVNPFYYDDTYPCQTSLSSSINLPTSSFNSSFPPPVVLAKSGVVVYNTDKISQTPTNTLVISNMIG